jgi:hypothetical protein
MGRRSKAALGRKKNAERARQCQLSRSKNQPLDSELLLIKTETSEEIGSENIDEIHFNTRHIVPELKQDISDEIGILTVHSSVSETEAPVIYQCSLCLTQFFTKSEIDSHQLNYHSVEPLDFEYKCTNLFTVLPFSSDPSSSSNTAQIKSHTCEPEPISVPCIGDIPVQNVQIPWPDDDTLKFKCKFCGERFSSETYRHEHLRLYYKIETSAKLIQFLKLFQYLVLNVTRFQSLS